MLETKIAPAPTIRQFATRYRNKEGVYDFTLMLQSLQQMDCGHPKVTATKSQQSFGWKNCTLSKLTLEQLQQLLRGETVKIRIGWWTFVDLSDDFLVYPHIGVEKRWPSLH